MNNKEEFDRWFFQFRSSLPDDLTQEVVPENALISHSVADCNKELTKVAFETTRNINRYTLSSQTSPFQVYPFINMRNYRFHASSTLLTNNFGVFGLNAGIYFALNDMCSTIIHRSDFFEDLLPTAEQYKICQCQTCGGNRDLSTWLKDYNWLVRMDTSTPPEPWLPLVYSTEPTPRSVIGGYLLLRSIYWICAHEIGHLLLNHHEILGELTHSETNSNIKVSSEYHHCVEIEADNFASSLDMELDPIVQSLNSRIDRAKSHSNYNGPWPIPDKYLAARILVITPLIVGVLLSILNNFTTIKHPHPKLRHTISFMWLMSKIRSLKLLEEDKIPSLYNNKDFQAIVHSCVMDKSLKEDILFFSDEEQKDQEKLLEKYFNWFIIKYKSPEDRLGKYNFEKHK